MTDSTAHEDALGERALMLRKKYYVRLAGVAAKCGCNYAEAGDVATDAVIALARQLSRGGSVHNEEAWLFVVTMRMAQGMVRLRRRHDRDHVPIDADLAERLTQSSWPTPEKWAEVAETLHAVRSLPDNYRDAVLLAWQQYSLAEIAACLDISVAAAQKRVSRGRELLARKIGIGLSAPERTKREGRDA